MVGQARREEAGTDESRYSRPRAAETQDRPRLPLVARRDTGDPDIGSCGDAAAAGLAQHAWYYFAIFAGVIAALVTEPLPNPAVGLIGLSLTAVVSRWVLYSPADQAKPGFNVVSQTINWALSGFSSTTVWLVAGAFMF